MEQFLIFQLKLPPEDSHKQSHGDCTKSADTPAFQFWKLSPVRKLLWRTKKRHLYYHQNLYSLEAVWKTPLSFPSCPFMLPCCGGFSCPLFPVYGGNKLWNMHAKKINSDPITWSTGIQICMQIKNVVIFCDHPTAVPGLEHEESFVSAQFLMDGSTWPKLLS